MKRITYNWKVDYSKGRYFTSKTPKELVSLWKEEAMLCIENTNLPQTAVKRQKDLTLTEGREFKLNIFSQAFMCWSEIW